MARLLVPVGHLKVLAGVQVVGRLSEGFRYGINEGHMNCIHGNVSTRNLRAWSDTPTSRPNFSRPFPSRPIFPSSPPRQAGGGWAVLSNLFLTESQPVGYTACTQSFLLDLSDLKVNTLGVVF